ncbi:ribonuclease h1 [Plakobranchus ocellatus]|uniref:ribonuclease H n=1 Tax=Plakobranchus ocellatus TaxID=259542 RepID=A0AAV4BY73_9GAST|nr:ribonuclease h1 [Plakobranchus ocellatus]
MAKDECYLHHWSSISKVADESKLVEELRVGLRGRSGSGSFSSLPASNGNPLPINTTLAALNSKVEWLYGAMHELNAKVVTILETVTRLESAVPTSTAPGAKRYFTRQSSISEGEREGKRFKRNEIVTSAFSGPEFNEQDGVHVYTDGGCFDNGKNGSRAGIGVYWGYNDPDNVSERLTGRPTNIRAEIHAAATAVRIAKRRGIKKLIVHTDSQFLINGITKWIIGWKKNGWKCTTGKPVINKDDFEAIDNQLSNISVKWVHVKSHSGDFGNEEADNLAKQGAKKPESS